jgi:conjugal transfer pilus assembly protein TraD
LWKQALKYQRDFWGFNCANKCHYDAFLEGGYTELKDKIMTLKDQWENDYYRSVAEDYLQTTLEVLIRLEKQVDLKVIAHCLDFQNLALLVRESKNERLTEKIVPLQHYDRQSLLGLQAHLSALRNSELGDHLLRGENTFTLKQVIAKKGIAYFALPALKFSNFSKVLGKLIINDIKSTIESLDGSAPISIIFDVFSVFWLTSVEKRRIHSSVFTFTSPYLIIVLLF